MKRSDGTFIRPCLHFNKDNRTGATLSVCSCNNFVAVSV
jgi:hypothetical protein